MTTGTFKYIDPSTYSGKPWVKIDCPDRAFEVKDHQKLVHNLRGQESDFTIDNSGFQIVTSPAREKLFTDETAIQESYYEDVEALIHKHMPGKVKKIHIFDHTIRRRTKNSPRQPVQQVHTDVTANATIDHVRRFLPAEELDSLLQGRYQIINVWRPIEFSASDCPLAVIDWRTTDPEDFITVDVMFPKPSDCNKQESGSLQKLPDSSTYGSLEGYELGHEAGAVQANSRHKWYYLKDMTPLEVMLFKCYDSFGEGQPFATKGTSVWTPHSAFVDPQTPEDAPARQSIEVRCLVFYE